MSAQIVRTALRSPLEVLAALLLFTAIGIVAGIAALDDLDLDGLPAPGSESDRALERLAEPLGEEPAPALTVIAAGELPISSPAARLALDTIDARIEALAAVARVRRGARTAAGMAITLEVLMDPAAGTAERLEALAQIRDGVDPGPLQLSVGGPLAALADGREQGEEDALRLGALALPLIVLVLGAAAGIGRMLAPLLAAALGLAGAGVLVALASLLLDPTIAIIGPAALVSILAAVDISGLAIARERAGVIALDRADAIKVALALVAAAAGAFAAFGALLAATSLIVPVPDLRSAALGAGIGALAGSAAGIGATATVLALGTQSGQAPTTPQPPRVLRLLARGTALRWGPTLGGAATLAAIPLAIAAIGAGTVGFGASELPAAAPAKEAEQLIVEGSGPGAATPAFAAVPEAGPAQIEGLRGRLLDREAVVGVSLPFAAGAETGLRVRIAARTGSLAAQDEVTATRSAGADLEAAVGGNAAELVDAGDRFGALGPPALLVVLLVLAAISARVHRAAISTALALTALIPLAAGLGAVELVFSGGALEGALGYSSLGAPHLGALIAVAVVLLAIAALRTVQLAGALAVERELDSSAAVALVASARFTFPAFAATTAVAVILGLALTGSDLLPVKEVGVGLLVGLAADLVLVRALLAPALIAMLHGRRAGRGALE